MNGIHALDRKGWPILPGADVRVYRKHTASKLCVVTGLRVNREKRRVEVDIRFNNWNQATVLPSQLVVRRKSKARREREHRHVKRAKAKKKATAAKRRKR